MRLYFLSCLAGIGAYFFLNSVSFAYRKHTNCPLICHEWQAKRIAFEWQKVAFWIYEKDGKGVMKIADRSKSFNFKELKASALFAVFFDKDLRFLRKWHSNGFN